MVALATALIASGRGLPRRRRRYLVLWAGGRTVPGGRGSRLATILRLHGVDVEEHEYYTAVGDRRYRRFKLVVRDERLLARLAELDEVRLRRLMKRYEGVVRSVLASMGRVRWEGILALVPESRLKRWLGIKPFSRDVYMMWRNRTVTRRLKPDWRAWVYVRREVALKTP